MRSGYRFLLLTAKYVELMEKLTAVVSYFIKPLPACNLPVGMNQGTLKLLENVQPLTAVSSEGMFNHGDLAALRSCSWGRWKEGSEVISSALGLESGRDLSPLCIRSSFLQVLQKVLAFLASLRLSV